MQIIFICVRYLFYLHWVFIEKKNFEIGFFVSSRIKHDSSAILFEKYFSGGSNEKNLSNSSQTLKHFFFLLQYLIIIWIWLWTRNLWTNVRDFSSTILLKKFGQISNVNEFFFWNLLYWGWNVNVCQFPFYRSLKWFMFLVLFANCCGIIRA